VAAVDAWCGGKRVGKVSHEFTLTRSSVWK
jgi:hypothetical protein